MPNTDRKAPKPLSPEWEAQNKHRKLADALDASYEPIFPEEEEFEAEEVVEEGAPRGKVIAQKATLNLCMKEKQLISPAVFVPVLLVILVLAALIGYFGVYMPYDSVKRAQEELDARKEVLEQMLDHTKDYNEVKDEFNKYNYEEFDRTLADRLDVLALLERTVFRVSTVRSLSVNNKTVSLTLTDISLDKVSELITTLNGEDLVAEVTVTTTGYQSSDSASTPTATMYILLNDADKVAEKEGK